MSLHTSYHADSDADDEYERSVITSPHLATDSEASPSESDFPSSEQTPTTFANADEHPKSPKTIITEWTVEECAHFLASLGLRQYCPAFLGEFDYLERGVGKESSTDKSQKMRLWGKRLLL
ncbi:unnamed protein product [Aspergillus oryzae]|uniref:Unnamed protein product n=2 Tax=Aspergillus oryzae TaxID=5062 RepID=A0AAN5BXP0_ASPOZ|nr:unnamed protein product [Aspergillus oryzae]GMF92654.1 unnamed protein product [Aspergillus oryzae]GMG14949.1 unnamed protein product [Aspergillus oryzae]GMG29487.1 unnamed protein product [Aspergillus oryzae]GMG47737.1 unnamed protein product [Aspergillus oryzae var. brunneus]